MEDCIQKLGSLYDDLAGIQAEVKVNGMSPVFLYRIKDFCVAMGARVLSMFSFGLLT